MTEESTLWLIEQGCRVMGIDAWGWDRPFNAIKEEFEQTHDKKAFSGRRTRQVSNMNTAI